MWKPLAIIERYKEMEMYSTFVVSCHFFAKIFVESSYNIFVLRQEFFFIDDKITNKFIQMEVNVAKYIYQNSQNLTQFITVYCMPATNNLLDN